MPWWKYKIPGKLSRLLIVLTTWVWVVTLVLFVLAYVLPFMAGLPSGGWKSASYELLFLFGNIGFLLAVISLPLIAGQLLVALVFMVVSIVRRQSRQALVCVGCTLVWFPLLACWHFRFAIEHDRSEPYSSVAERGNLIVAALESYRAANGQYPEEIEDLVPEYIESIPDPGIVSCRRGFGYSRYEQDSGSEDPYYLAAPIFMMFMDFDALVYAHGKTFNYPVPIFDGWAYFDD